jgi:hypothetical protein
MGESFSPEINKKLETCPYFIRGRSGICKSLSVPLLPHRSKIICIVRTLNRSGWVIQFTARALLLGLIRTDLMILYSSVASVYLNASNLELVPCHAIRKPNASRLKKWERKENTGELR